MTKIAPAWIADTAAQQVCRILTDAGYGAWFVGGCVRNALLGVAASDIDITTDARPKAVMALAQQSGLRAIPTGIEHGTVTLVIDSQPFEVTTLRRDVETDGRRAIVAFSDSLEEDARRRDFTMNAIYACPDGTVIDPLDGLPDLRARRVRFIDDPEQRIAEDALRILRFFRFTAAYGDPTLGIDADGLAACAQRADDIDGLSKERIGSEILKILGLPDPSPAMATMEASGVLMRVLAGATASYLAVLVHLEEGLDLKPDAIRRLAVLGGAEPAEALRLSKAQARRLDNLGTDQSDPRWIGYHFGADQGLDILTVQSAILGHNIDTNKAKIIKNAACQTLPIKAKDLVSRYAGPQLGQALKEAEARWVNSGFTLTRDELLA